MTDAEKWRTLAQALAVTVPIGTLTGLGLGWLIGGTGASTAAGAVIGLLVATGFISFDVGWTVGLIARRWREAPFLVVIVTRSLVWLAIIVVGISLPLVTVAGLSLAELVDRQFVIAVTIVSVLDLPSDIATESLGRIELRGLQDSVELIAMTRAADRPTTA
jgi:hypothetical protein